MFERILVALDGSKPAEMVIPYAEEIAAKLGSRLMLVSVSESAGADTEHLYQAYLKRMADQVQNELWEWGVRDAAHVEGKILVGKPANAILRRADRSNVGLLVMASRGSSGQGRPWLLGSIAAKVLRATGKPVLLIRAPAKREAVQQRRLIRKILVPLDGSGPGESAIPYAEALAQASGAELVLAQVLEPAITWGSYEGYASYRAPEDWETRKASATAYLDDVGKQLKERGITASSVVVLGSPAEQIIDYAKANSIDLIAMSTHGRSGIGRWVFGSVADKVLHAGDTPVLVVRPAKA